MAAIPKSEPEYTPEDVLHMQDGGIYEVVEGRLVEVNVGAVSLWVANQLAWLLREFALAGAGGLVLTGEAGLTIFPWNPDRLRRADVVYYRAGRLDAAHLPSGHLTLVPDLVAEVISPRDIAEEVESKVREYLRAGVPVIWLVYPEARTVHVIRPGGRATLLDDAGTLTGEEILPGFETPVSKLFPAG